MGKTKVQLSLHAKGLPNVAGRFKGKSDPFAIVHLVTAQQGAEPVELGKTEVVDNNLSPLWTKKFIFDYELGSPLHVSVQVFDEIKKGTNKTMGSAMFDIGSVLGSKGGLKAKRMKGGGTLYARVEKYTGSGTLRLQLRGLKLKNVEGMLKKSDPFYELHKPGPSGTGWDIAYRSSPVMDNLSPVWSDAVIDLGTLCKGDTNKPVQVAIFDYEKSGKHVPMGEFVTSVSGLVAAKGLGGTGDVNDADLASAFTLTKKGKETGQIIVLRADVIKGDGDDLTEKMASVKVTPTAAAPAPAPAASVPPAFAPSSRGTPAPAGATFVPPPPPPSFVDYIRGGCELNLAVAIDFSASNGDPRVPGSPHYFTHDGQKNDYEQAIESIGSVLANYDSDQQFPVWGFGAKYAGVIRHCFQCGTSQEVKGVSGIRSAYRQVFKSGLAMSEPTVYTEVIQTSANRAKNAQSVAKKKGQQAYTILLILSDGKVTDVNATFAAIDQVNDSPLSIVIVGIGDADFSGMQYLDDTKRKGKRDIVQFVPFNAYRQNMQALTAATLNEIPDQLVSYFTSHGIMPNAPVVKGDDDIEIEEYQEGSEVVLNF